MTSNTESWEKAWVKGDRLGGGGQGHTYRCQSVADPNRPGVLKVLRNNGSLQARRRMRQEVVNLEILSKTNANVPNVLDHNTAHFEDKGTSLYVVMDLVDGPTLGKFINENGPLDLERATAVVRQLCDTVNVAHENNVLHRDLKPENIIVRRIDPPEIVIVDYGLSFNFDLEERVTRTDESFRNEFLSLPETNTPGGDRRDRRSDITALCGIFYYCLTGHAPGQLQGGDGHPPHMRTGYSVKERLPGDPRVNQIELMMNCGFSPNIESRFQTVADFVNRFEQASQASPIGSTEDPVEVAMRESARLRRLDRRSQLADFRKPATNGLRAMTDYAAKLREKLGRFHISSSIGGGNYPPLPGLEWVPCDVARIQINIAHHNNLRSVSYRVASRAEQCVLVRRTSRRGAEESQEIVAVDWTNVYWFDGNAEMDAQAAIDDLKKWLAEAMKELSNEVAA